MNPFEELIGEDFRKAAVRAKKQQLDEDWRNLTMSLWMFFIAPTLLGSILLYTQNFAYGIGVASLSAPLTQLIGYIVRPYFQDDYPFEPDTDTDDFSMSCPGCGAQFEDEDEYTEHATDCMDMHAQP